MVYEPAVPPTLAIAPASLLEAPAGVTLAIPTEAANIGKSIESWFLTFDHVHLASPPEVAAVYPTK